MDTVYDIDFGKHRITDDAGNKLIVGDYEIFVISYLVQQYDDLWDTFHRCAANDDRRGMSEAMWDLDEIREELDLFGYYVIGQTKRDW